MPPVRPSEATEAIIAAGRRLGSRGLISAGEGNLSVRVEGGLLAITPSGRHKDELGDGDVVLLGPALDESSARAMRSDAGHGPSSDLRVHLAIHAARADVAAVAHAHLPAAMALTVAGEIPDPAVLPETALFLPRIPYLSFGEPGSQDLADRIARALTEPPEPFANVVLLERHGAVAVGPDLETAVDRLELLEVLCRTWRDSLLIRAAGAAGRTK
jgi:L-fuculose-phosphate aldolase